MKPKRPLTELAQQAGITPTWWRAILSGYRQVNPGVYMAQRGSAETIARMAQAVGVDSMALAFAGRHDAAAQLELLEMSQTPAPPPTDVDPRPVGADVDTSGLPDEDVEAVRRLVRQLKAARGIE